jgi:hypothetical protein
LRWSWLCDSEGKAETFATEAKIVAGVLDVT